MEFMYKIEVYPLGIYQANCYLVWKENHLVMIDPGGKSKQLIQQIEEKKGIVDAILLTHGHFDHIGGVDYYASYFDCPVFIDEMDEPLLRDVVLNCSLPGRETTVKTAVQHYCVGKNSIGNFIFQVYFAPGHTRGCVMLELESYLFSGDVLFQGSIGRCDLPQSDPKAMRKSLNMIKKMKPSLIVYPGHGPATTLKDEMLYNPYLIR